MSLDADGGMETRCRSVPMEENDNGEAIQISRLGEVARKAATGACHVTESSQDSGMGKNKNFIILGRSDYFAKLTFHR